MKRTTVRATCNKCGDVSTTIENVTLRILEGSNDQIGQYRFICPECKMIILKTADPGTISLLSSSGAKREYYNPSLEILEHPSEGGAIISLDDIIALHFDLEEHEEAWMGRMENNSEE